MIISTALPTACSPRLSRLASSSSAIASCAARAHRTQQCIFDGTGGGDSSTPSPLIRTRACPGLPCLRSSARYVKGLTRAAQALTPAQPSHPPARSRCAGLPPRRASCGAPAQVTDSVDAHALLAPSLPLTRASPRRARALDVRPSQVLTGHLILSALARLLPPPLARTRCACAPALSRDSNLRPSEPPPRLPSRARCPCRDSAFLSTRTLGTAAGSSRLGGPGRGGGMRIVASAEPNGRV